MILQWKSNGPLESISKWQGIGLTAKYLPATCNWRLALTGAALERIIERRAQSQQPPVAKQRAAASGRSGGAYISRPGSNIMEGPSVRLSGVFSGFSRFGEEHASDASDGASYAS